MITILKGDIKQLKEEMKIQKKLATQIRQAVVKGMSKKKVGPEYYSLRDQKTIAEAELKQSFFEVSRFLPVKLESEGIIINYLMLKEFEKRLKGFQIQQTFEVDEIGKKLVVDYKRGSVKGKLELYELPTAIFGSLTKMPTIQMDALVTA